MDDRITRTIVILSSSKDYYNNVWIPDLYAQRWTRVYHKSILIHCHCIADVFFCTVFELNAGLQPTTNFGQ